jgi:hypothetical protein
MFVGLLARNALASAQLLDRRISVIYFLAGSRPYAKPEFEEVVEGCAVNRPELEDREAP